MKTARGTMLACALACAAVAGAARLARAQEAGTQAGVAPDATAAAQKPATPPRTQKIVRQGVEVEFTIEPVASADKQRDANVSEGQDAVVRFRVTDTATRTPLAGVRPSVWMSMREGGPPTPEACKEKIRSFLQGSLRARPDVDLNGYYMLALNSEPNISVIDPLLGFGGTKLATLVLLKSPGEDWVLTPDQERLFVSMPEVNQVAVVDTNTWKVVANVETGARPVRLALQSDGKDLWVGTDGGAQGGVTVIDAATFEPVARIPTGAGHHEIALGGDSLTAFVTNRDSGTLSIIDVQKLSKVSDVNVGRRAVAVAVSPLSKLAYVSDDLAGRIAAVDGRAARVVTQIEVAPGVGAVRFAPGGRYGFAPGGANSAVYVFDVSTNRLLHTLKVGTSPDQITFTREFAYVRAAGANEVTMIRLSTVGKEPDLVHFPAGQAAPAESKTAAATGDSIVPTPEGNSVLVANVADRQIYYYTEGMAAPMGNFQNYKREPRAVLIADRSLREVKTGTYERVTRLPKSGTYDVAVLLDSPRVTHCFETSAAENPAALRERATPLSVEYLDKERPLRAGQDYKLRFSLKDAATGGPADGLKDVRVLVFLSPGIWQNRAFAAHAGGGVYELTLNVPQPGLYMIFVESQSRGVSFRQLPYLMLRATAGADSAPAHGTLPASP